MRLSPSDRRLESTSWRGDFPNGAAPHGHERQAETSDAGWPVAALLLGYVAVIVLGMMLAF